MRCCVVGLLIWTWPVLALGSDTSIGEIERLPGPQLDGGRPLMAVLRDRKSTREFSPQPVSREQLANLLWAAFGVNRSETGHRTAPCTMNLRSVDIYIATTDGAYRYDADAHQLILVNRKDIRALTGGQDYVKTAPLALVYVADHVKFAKVAPEERSFYAAADTGFIGQNVYLYCASEGLGCVIHMPGDRAGMQKALELRPEQKIVLVQSVGHPAD